MSCARLVRRPSAPSCACMALRSREKVTQSRRCETTQLRLVAAVALCHRGAGLSGSVTELRRLGGRSRYSAARRRQESTPCSSR